MSWSYEYFATVTTCVIVCSGEGDGDSGLHSFNIRNAPNLSLAKDLYLTAVSNITDKAVIEKLYRHLPDDEDTRSKIAGNVAKKSTAAAAAAVLEGLKFVPDVVYFSYY
ncbi:hypothetical protein Pint_04917 [Pistacia integerrima]|uniref:Uncharacterized protein n=1 Tax=Pistacia integerrima TaxID=434235 RepID=A0ACC0Z629_9ROSI|nr:hypothetical protein Pint_04917 [Pistacia integerrima]